MAAKKQGAPIYQLKVTVRGVKPPVWREAFAPRLLPRDDPSDS